MSAIERLKGRKDRRVQNIFRKMAESMDLLNRAVLFKDRGDYEKAIEILNEILKDNPQNGLARAELGSTLLMKGDLAEGESVLMEYLDIHYFGNSILDNLVLQQLGKVKFEYHKDTDTALKFFTQALDFDHISAKVPEEKINAIKSDIHLDLCRLHLYRKDYDSAKKYAFKRLDFDPECYFASHVLASCFLNEFVYSSELVECIANGTSPFVLTDLITLFSNCLKHKEDDYQAMYGIAVSRISLEIWAECNGQVIDEAFTVGSKEYMDRLWEGAKTSEEAREYQQKVIDFVGSLTKRLMVFGVGKSRFTTGVPK